MRVTHTGTLGSGRAARLSSLFGREVRGEGRQDKSSPIAHYFLGNPRDTPTVDVDLEAHACADLAYTVSDSLIMCVQRNKRNCAVTRQFVKQLKVKASQHFHGSPVTSMRCGLTFVITDGLAPSSMEAIGACRPNLHAVLVQFSTDCLYPLREAHIVVVDTGSAAPRVMSTLGAWLRSSSATVECATLEAVECARTTAQEDWLRLAEQLLLLRNLHERDEAATLQRARRASCIQPSLDESVEAALKGGDWPLNAASLWAARKDMAIAVGACAFALTADVVTAGASVAAYSSAAATAASANAAANTLRAWLFGLGQYAAAAAAAEAAAARAATGAVVMTTWSALDTVSVLAVTRRSLRRGEDAGSRCASPATAALRIGDACEVMRSFRFTASAQDIKAGIRYRDILLYPEGTVTGWSLERITSLPFLLRHAATGRHLFINDQEAGCCSGVRSNQFFWAVPVAQDGEGSGAAFELRGAFSGAALTAVAGGFRGGWRVAAAAEAKAQEPAGCKAAALAATSGPGLAWQLMPGSRPGTVRLKSACPAAGGRCLQRGGWDLPVAGAVREWLTLAEEGHPCQDWLVVPRPPVLIGEFRHREPDGEAQLYWPDGCPAFQGEVRQGKLHDGFVFDTLGMGHGRFHFGATCSTPPEADSLQPEEKTEVDRPSITSGKVAWKPCGHSPLCEADAS